MRDRPRWSGISSAPAGLGQDAYVALRVAHIPPSDPAFQEHQEKESKEEN